MVSKRKVVVGLDFSTDFSSIVPKLIKVAQALRAELIPVYSIVRDDSVLESKAANIDEMYDQLPKLCESTFAGQGVSVRRLMIVRQPIHEVLLELDRELKPNLIVIGQTTHTDQEFMNKPTLKSYLLANTNSPVLALAERGKSEHHQAILCPVDFSLASKQAVISSINLSILLQAELHLLHVLPMTDQVPVNLEEITQNLILEHLEVPQYTERISPVHTTAMKLLKTDLQKNDTQTSESHHKRTIKSALRRLQSFLNEVGKCDVSNIQIHLQYGSPDQAISSLTQKLNIDLLVHSMDAKTGYQPRNPNHFSTRLLSGIACSQLRVKEIGMFGGHITVAKLDALLQENSLDMVVSAGTRKHLKQGLDALANNNTDAAFRELQIAVRETPEEPAPYLALAKTCMLCGNTLQASVYLEAWYSYTELLAYV
ncbi:MAG: universal stress protein [Lentisphaeria bacterium]|nr:universal stress protein [Lentisphaeria bacterium]